MRKRVCGGSAETRNYLLQTIYYCFSWSRTLQLRVRKKKKRIRLCTKVIGIRTDTRISSGVSGVARVNIFIFIYLFFPASLSPPKRKRERKSVPWRFTVYQTGTFRAGTYWELLKTFCGRNKQRKVDRININNGIYDRQGLADTAGPKVRTRIGRWRAKWGGRCRRKTP